MHHSAIQAVDFYVFEHISQHDLSGNHIYCCFLLINHCKYVSMKTISKTLALNRSTQVTVTTITITMACSHQTLKGFKNL